MKTVQQISADAVLKMLAGTFRSPDHARTCGCRYCENAAANLLSKYSRDIDAAIAKRDKPKARKTK